MTDIAALSFAIDSSGIKRSSEDMQRLIDNSRRLNEENERLEKRVRELQTRYKAYNDELVRSNRETKEQTSQVGGLGQGIASTAMKIIDAPLVAAGAVGQGVGYGLGSSVDFTIEAIERKLGFKFSSINPVAIASRIGSRIGEQFSSFGEYERTRQPDMQQFITEMKLFSDSIGTSLPNLRHWQAALKDSGVTMNQVAAVMDRFRRMSFGDPSMDTANRVLETVTGQRPGPRAQEGMLLDFNAAIRRMPASDARNALIASVYGSSGTDVQAMIQTSRPVSAMEQLAIETEQLNFRNVAQQRERKLDEMSRYADRNAADRIRVALPAAMEGTEDYAFSQVGRGGGFGAMVAGVGSFLDRTAFRLTSPMMGPEGVAEAARKWQERDLFFRGMASPEGPGLAGAVSEVVNNNFGDTIKGVSSALEGLSNFITRLVAKQTGPIEEDTYVGPGQTPVMPVPRQGSRDLMGTGAPLPVMYPPSLMSPDMLRRQQAIFDQQTSLDSLPPDQAEIVRAGLQSLREALEPLSDKINATISDAVGEFGRGLAAPARRSTIRDREPGTSEKDLELIGAYTRSADYKDFVDKVKGEQQRSIVDYGKRSYGYAAVDPGPPSAYLTEARSGFMANDTVRTEFERLKNETGSIATWSLDQERAFWAERKKIVDTEIKRLVDWQEEAQRNFLSDLSPDRAQMEKTLRELPGARLADEKNIALANAIRQRDEQFRYQYALESAPEGDLGRRMDIMRDRMGQIRQGAGGDEAAATQMAAMIGLMISKIQQMADRAVLDMRRNEARTVDAGDTSMSVAGASAATAAGRASAGAALGAQAEGARRSAANEVAYARTDFFSTLVGGKPGASTAETDQAIKTFGDAFDRAVRARTAEERARTERELTERLQASGINLPTNLDLRGRLNAARLAQAQGEAQSRTMGTLAGAANQAVITPFQLQIEQLDRYDATVSPLNRQFETIRSQAAQQAIRAGISEEQMFGLQAALLQRQELKARQETVVDLGMQGRYLDAERATVGRGGSARARVEMQAAIGREALDERVAKSPGLDVEKERAALETERLARLQLIGKQEALNYEQMKQATKDDLEYQKQSFELLGQSDGLRAKELTYLRAKRDLTRQFEGSDTVKEPDIDKMAKDQAEAAKYAADVAKATNYASQYAGTFVYRLEDAITNFRDMRSLVGALSADIQRIALREVFLDPLKNALTGTIAKASVGNGIQDAISGGLGWITKGIGSIFGFADGGVMTTMGPAALPVMAYAVGGVADRPQVAIFGEGRKKEAYIPLNDGKNVEVARRKVAGKEEFFIPLPDGRMIPAKLGRDDNPLAESERHFRKAAAMFAQGGVMTPIGPAALSATPRPTIAAAAKASSYSPMPDGRSAPSSSVARAAGPAMQANITVNVDGKSGSGNSDGREMGTQIAGEIVRGMRGMVADEIRKQMRPGGVLNPGI